MPDFYTGASSPTQVNTVWTGNGWGTQKQKWGLSNGQWGWQDASGAAGASYGNPDFESTLARINQLNLGAQQQANAARIPNASDLETKSSGNISSALSGQLPSDVITQMQQQAGERGIATGTAGSPNNNAAYLRALGLNSLNMQNTGQQWLTAALGRNPSAPIYDPTHLMLTPYQQAQISLAEQGLANDRLRTGMSALRGGGGGYGHPFAGKSSSPGIDYNSLIPNTPSSTGGSGLGTGNAWNSNWSDWENEFWNGSPSDYSSYGLNPSFDYLTNPFIGTYDNAQVPTGAVTGDYPTLNGWNEYQDSTIWNDPFFNDYGGYGYEDFYGG